MNPLSQMLTSPQQALGSIDPGELQNVLAMLQDPAQLARFSAAGMDRPETSPLMQALMEEMMKQQQGGMGGGMGIGGMMGGGMPPQQGMGMMMGQQPGY